MPITVARASSRTPGIAGPIVCKRGVGQAGQLVKAFPVYAQHLNLEVAPGSIGAREAHEVGGLQR